MENEAIGRHIALLGKPVVDKVTKFRGVVVSLSFDLFGCIQAVVKPYADADKGELKDGHWFDITRLEVESDSRVMPLPEFSKGYIAEGKKGPAAKTIPNSL